MENITIEELEPGFFLVRVGDRFADRLTKDEALGVVASALFSEKGPIFVRTYEQEVRTPWSYAHLARNWPSRHLATLRLNSNTRRAGLMPIGRPCANAQGES